jgi:hypothetical protein
MLLGFLKKDNNEFIMTVDWPQVHTHAEKVASSLNRGSR